MPKTAAIAKAGLVVAVAFIVVLAGIGTSIYMSSPQRSFSSALTTCNCSPTTTSTNITYTSKNFISIENESVSLCPRNCLYPSPFLSATLFVNSTAPLKWLQLYINGTFESTHTYTNNYTNYAIDYQTSPDNQTLPIMSDNTYIIAFVATFQDGTVSNASTIVFASPESTETMTSQTSQTSTPQEVPSYSMTNTNVSSVNSTLGLSLQLFAAPSNGSLGDLATMASVVNIRNVSNNVTDQSNWKYPLGSLNPFSPCGVGQVGFGIFQGNYDKSNFSKATALTLYNESIVYSCTTMTIVNSTEVFSFQPQSDLVQVTNSSGVPFFNSSISVYCPLIGGYWIGQIGSGAYQTFPSGNYTMIAADEWGQVVFLHFSVVTAASTTSSTMTTTCSAGYVNGTCEPKFTTTTTSFDGASYCLGSNKCSALYPPGVANPNIENSPGGNLTFRFSSNVKLQVVQTQGCVSTDPSCTHNDLAILLQTTPQCSASGNTTLCTFVTDGISLPSVSATGNYVEIALNYGLSANQTLGSETYYLAVQ